jgi:hypothetical protein
VLCVAPSLCRLFKQRYVLITCVYNHTGSQLIGLAPHYCNDGTTGPVWPRDRTMPRRPCIGRSARAPSTPCHSRLGRAKISSPSIIMVCVCVAQRRHAVAAESFEEDVEDPGAGGWRQSYAEVGIEYGLVDGLNAEPSTIIIIIIIIAHHHYSCPFLLPMMMVVDFRVCLCLSCETSRGVTNNCWPSGGIWAATCDCRVCPGVRWQGRSPVIIGP